MKDILIKQLGILDFAIGSPRETLHQSFTNKIIDDDRWLQMLRARNQLAHDYDGTFAAEKFQDIINVYYPLFEKLRDNVKKYYITEQTIYRKEERFILNALWLKISPYRTNKSTSIFSFSSNQYKLLDKFH